MKLFSIFLTAGLTVAAHAAEPLRITGSNTFGEKLGPLLVAGFKKMNPGVAVELKRPGSGPGLEALLAGRADIAPTSRPANRSELLAARKAGVRLIPQHIGDYGIVVIVNAANPVKSLNPSQVRALFTGKTTSWGKVRGTPSRVKVYALGPNTGARAGFRNLAMRGDEYAATTEFLPDYRSIIAAVANDPNGVGYADMGPLPSGVRALLINGKPGNSTSINKQVYPYANPLYLYTVEGRDTPGAEKFLRYALSKSGQRIIKKAGFVPRLLAPPPTARSLAP